MKSHDDIRLHLNLLEEEKVLWTGRPQPGNTFSYGDYLIFVYTAALVVLSLIISLLYIDEPQSFLILLAIIVPTAATLTALAIKSNRQPSLVTYGLTNNRIFIKPDLDSTTSSLLIENLPTVEYQEKRNGLGTILFFHENIIGQNGSQYYASSIIYKNARVFRKPMQMAFHNIQNAKSVYKKILELKQKK